MSGAVIGSVLMLVGIGIMVGASIALVRPLPLLGLMTKKRAGWTVVASYFILFAGSGIVRQTVPEEEIEPFLFLPSLPVFGASILSGIAVFILSCIDLFRPLPKFWLLTAGYIFALSVGSIFVIGLFIPEPRFPTPEEIAARAEAERQKARAHISDITFSQVYHLFDAVNGTLTDIQKEEEWKKYEGKCVEWTGRLEEVKKNFLFGLMVGFKHRNDTLTFDVLVDAPSSEEERLMSWRQGRSYTYEATLKDYGGIISPITADWGCD